MLRLPFLRTSSLISEESESRIGLPTRSTTCERTLSGRADEEALVAGESLSRRALLARVMRAEPAMLWQQTWGDSVGNAAIGSRRDFLVAAGLHITKAIKPGLEVPSSLAFTKTLEQSSYSLQILLRLSLSKQRSREQRDS
jgi:hypothetical protein